MQIFRTVIGTIFLMNFGCSAAHAAHTETCSQSALLEVRSITALAPELRAQLGADRSGHSGIADRGGKFNASDNIVDETPTRRFAMAAIGEKCALIVVERGGRGHWIELQEFVLIESTWKERRHKAIRNVPNSVSELVVYAKE